MNYHPWPDSHIRDKVKVVITIDLSNYATKNELEHAIGINTCDLAAKKDFIASRTEIDKFGITQLTNVSTSWNNLKTKIVGSDVGKLFL